MKIDKISGNHNEIALIQSEIVLIHDVQSAIDLIAEILYGMRIDYIILRKRHFTDEFFDLKTGLLGAIIQKFSNYAVKVAIVGDYKAYQTKSFKDFIRESNNGRTLFFVANEEDALNKLNLYK